MGKEARELFTRGNTLLYSSVTVMWGGFLMVFWMIPAICLAASTTHRGVCWVAATEPITTEHLRPLLENNVSWISQTTFAWQLDAHSPEIRLQVDSDWWGESDTGIVQTTVLARQVGIMTLLKPHLGGPEWSGNIEMDNDAEWRQWFDNYRRFIMHYARLAEAAHIEVLCIGTELQKTTTITREKEWREIIAEIRGVYRGSLVYAANWDQEFEQIRFWDALDYIGVQAYFPLTDHETPSLPELLQGWKSHLERIKTLQQVYGKPVLITEFGYRSEADAAIRPWLWEMPKATSDTSKVGFTDSGLQTQASCYEAFFQVFSREEWFAGAYVWKWFPSPKKAFQEHLDPFSPQGKPAEKILKMWYGKSGTPH